MRSLLFVALVTLGTATVEAAPGAGVGAPSVPQDAAPTTTDRFPLPADATSSNAKGGGGRIQLHKVPRARTAVIAEVRAALTKGRWEIVDETPSPSGNALRLTVKKSARTWKVSFTGNDKQTAIVLTLPG